MLYLVGLGLCDATDITVKGLEVVKQASRVYLEAYTSILTVGKEELVWYLRLFASMLVIFWSIGMAQVQEKFYGREVILADRDMVEQNSGLYDHLW